MSLLKRHKRIIKSAWIEMFHGDDDKWYFHKKAANGKITEQSQGYKQRRYAREAIHRDFPGFEIRVVDSDG